MIKVKFNIECSEGSSDYQKKLMISDTTFIRADNKDVNFAYLRGEYAQFVKNYKKNRKERKKIASDIANAAALSVCNSVLTNKRVSFALSRESLRSLLRTDKNLPKRINMGFRNEYYPFILKVLNQILKAEWDIIDAKKPACFTILEESIIDELGLSNDDIAGQRKEVLDFLNKTKKTKNNNNLEIVKTADVKPQVSQNQPNSTIDIISKYSLENNSYATDWYEAYEVNHGQQMRSFAEPMLTSEEFYADTELVNKVKHNMIKVLEKPIDRFKDAIYSNKYREPRHVVDDAMDYTRSIAADIRPLLREIVIEKFGANVKHEGANYVKRMYLEAIESVHKKAISDYEIYINHNRKRRAAEKGQRLISDIKHINKIYDDFMNPNTVVTDPDSKVYNTSEVLKDPAMQEMLALFATED